MQSTIKRHSRKIGETGEKQEPSLLRASPTRAVTQGLQMTVVRFLLGIILQTPALMLRLGVEKAGLKLDIQKTKIMAAGPITSWQIEGEKVETVTEFIFLGSKNTADGNCRHEIERRLLLGRKVMTDLDSILKSYGFSSSHVQM